MSYSTALDDFIDIIEGTAPTWKKLEPFRCLDRGAEIPESAANRPDDLVDAVGYGNRWFTVTQRDGPTVFEETTGLPGYWISTLDVVVAYNIQTKTLLDRVTTQDVVEITKNTYHPNNWGPAIDMLNFLGVTKIQQITENQATKGYLVTLTFEMMWIDPVC